MGRKFESGKQSPAIINGDLAKAVSSMVAASTGIALSPVIGWSELALVTGLVVVGGLLALVPAIRFYREPIINALR